MYRKIVGFVPQEDIMLRELNVQNILSHSGATRLPTSMSRTRCVLLVERNAASCPNQQGRSGRSWWRA